MALVSFNDVIIGEFSDKFYIEVDDKQIEAVTPLYRYSDYTIYYIHKDLSKTKIYNKHYDLFYENIASILNVSIDTVRVYTVDSLFDALYNHEEDIEFLFKNGNYRATWFKNLINRFCSYPKSFEARRRAQQLLDYLNDNPNIDLNEIPLWNEISRFIKFEYFKQKFIYLRALEYENNYSGWNEEEHAINKDFDIVSVGSFSHNFYEFYTEENYKRRLVFIFDSENSEFQNLYHTRVPKWVVSYLKEQKLIFTCKKCNKAAPKNSFVKENICSECCEYNLNLFPYNTKATDYFDFKTHKLNKNKVVRYFGIEIEYEYYDEDTKIQNLYYAMTHLNKHVILKRDGSVEGGVELTSAPSDIQSHKEVFKSFFENIHDNFKGSGRTGMHIHVDKGRRLVNPHTKKVTYTKMSFLTIGKINHFMRNVKNANFIYFVAERVSNNYANVDGNHEFTHVYSHDVRDYRNDLNRYASVNFQNKETIEFRIFASPENYFTFCKNLEFCDALVTFCSSSNFGLQELTVDKFIKFVDNNRKEYSSLSKFLKTYDSKLINFVPKNKEEDYDEDYDDESEDSEEII